MSMPLENHHPRGSLDGRLLDRLVDGELLEEERRELLLRLESEPDGWRRCALAFLEAQSWREVLAPVAMSVRTPRRPVVVPGGQGRKRPAWRPLARLTALAAGLAAAFALGWAWHGGPAEEVAHDPVAKVESVGQPAVSEPIQPATAGPGVRETRPLEPEEPSALLGPVVKQWEQRGYRAEMQRRMVSMELKDGRKLRLPVHEVRLRYIGDRTY